ncbi:MAG: UDP-2,4-diacetamido-2,4,6-trideoxy-beta-L-altropyranose hydrolase [Candidatus Omnitrophica bacterium]|nr:UDP-2,4-diacetamido-2,4,6-trideoxy-beta-L-altropyranose hydrolase [Candidatus Omnitrophota bacterium]MBU1997685.1 UDP-2,4-diacetamido-2,4,6-trideoxy-beta-L-altropyranose hydrolase [Candidatus Omnitrophota bacterium]
MKPDLLMGKRNALFRVDASQKIGLGHLMRCRILATKLVNRGWHCSFLTNDRDGITGKLCSEEELNVINMDSIIGSSDDLKKLIERARELNASLIITDSYAFDSKYLQAVASLGITTVNFDDLTEVAQFSDIIINPSCCIKDYDLPQSKTERMYLLGPKYAMIHDKFRKAREETVHLSETAKNLLITLGGGSIDEQIVEACTSAALSLKESFATVIVNEASEELIAIEKAYGKDRLHILKNTTQMADLMKKADIIISAGGSTCWEKCCIGIPGFTIVLSKDQEPVGVLLEKVGASKMLKPSDVLLKDVLTKQLQELAENKDARKAMKTKGRELVDGLGAERVVDIIEETTAENRI